MDNKETLTVLKSIDEKLDNLNHPTIWRSFFQGLLTGFGTVIGATILITIAITILQNFITVPLIGEWVSDIIEIVNSRIGTR